MKGILLAIAMLFSLLQFYTGNVTEKVSSKTYYVDSRSGNDANSGTSATRAWKTLQKVNSIVFKAGDRILFKAGSVFRGQLKPQGQGRKGALIEIDQYGKGAKPRIEGEGSELSALYLFNVEYWKVSNLDISNTGTETAAKRCGVRVELENFGTAHEITLNALDIHDVNGSLVKNEGGGAGIICSNEGKTVSIFDGLLIEGCKIINCQRNGILINGYWNRSNWHPSKHVIIRRNLLEGVPGDGIVPIGCDSALIERNVMRNCPRLLPDGEAAAGIWPWSCDNTIVQYNEVSDHKAPWDGQGFDSDWNCRNTIIQYNYSHDNEGGFLLVCNDGGVNAPASIGNTGTVVRYNLSVNDGLRVVGKHAGFSPVFHLAGPASNTKIYNNVIYITRKADGIDTTLVEMGDWKGYCSNTVFSNNIFYSLGKVDYELAGVTSIVFKSNLYYGEHIKRPVDSQAIFDDPLFLNKLPGKNRSGLKVAEYFKLSQKSAAIGKGEPIVDKDIIDFFGNPVKVKAKPTLGIVEYSN